MYYNLVRDKVPDRLRLRGVHCETRAIEGSEYAAALDRKLQEEVLDYLDSSHGEHQLEDIANILEVIHEIIGQKGKRYDEIEELRLQMREKKGDTANIFC